RQHGAGKRDVAVLAGQAAAWRAGPVDREPVAADHPGAVPLSHGMGEPKGSPIANRRRMTAKQSRLPPRGVGIINFIWWVRVKDGGGCFSVLRLFFVPFQKLTMGGLDPPIQLATSE